jgi:DNA polymerase-1
MPFSLGWPTQIDVLDLAVEFKRLTNITYDKKRETNPLRPAGSGLIGAAFVYGISGITKSEKDMWRDLVLRGGPWTAEEKEGILNYCEGNDVKMTAQLLVSMVYDIFPNEKAAEDDLDRALIRSQYAGESTAYMFFTGVPIDTDRVSRLQQHREAIIRDVIAEVDKGLGVYEDGSFIAKRFEDYLSRNNIRWPYKESRGKNNAIHVHICISRDSI